MLFVFVWWQFQTNSRESYISYACGSSKVICNIQTDIAIEAPKSIWILTPPRRKFAQNLLGTKRSSWLVVHRERLRKRVAERVSLEVGYLRFALERRAKTNRQSRGLRLGSERDDKRKTSTKGQSSSL